MVFFVFCVYGSSSNTCSVYYEVATCVLSLYIIKPLLPSPSPSPRVQLSARAVRDYNRGRAYLASIANKNRVPVYTNISDAVHRAMHLVQGHYLTHSHSQHPETSV